MSSLQKTLLALAVATVFAAPAMAAADDYTYSTKTITVDGTPMATLRIYDVGQEIVYPKDVLNSDEDEKAEVTQKLSAVHEKSTVNALRYVKDVFGTPKTVPTIDVLGVEDDIAMFASPTVSKNGGSTRLSTYFSAGATNSDWPTGILYLGKLQIRDADIKPLIGRGEGMSLGSTVMHEFMHGMGITTEAEIGKKISNVSTFASHLRDINGNAFEQGKTVQVKGQEKVVASEGFTLYDVDSYSGTYFVGDNVTEVLNGAVIKWPDDVMIPAVSGIPVNGLEDDEDASGKFIQTAELSHLELQNSMMSHQNYRNWGTFMEAELAVLQDMGYDIDRRKFFGFSVYNDNLTLENNHAFNSSQDWGIGLHVYGSNNTITQKADLLTKGDYAYGIRVDGVGNRISVDSGTTIKANGTEGYGILVSYGSSHNIDIKGNVEAMGAGGNALRFDFGGNLLGDETEYRGSYLRILQNEDGEWESMTEYDGTPSRLDALQGALVNTVNISGSIKGKQAAIYISDNAFVKDINILNGAAIKGDIISEWDPDSCAYGAYDGETLFLNTTKTSDELRTNIAFGVVVDEQTGEVTEDENFSMTYDNNIMGPAGLNMALHGGTLNYGGTAMVNDLITLENSSLNLKDKAVVSANNINADGLVTIAEKGAVSVNLRETDSKASFAEVQNNGALALSTSNTEAGSIAIKKLNGTGDIALGLDSNTADRLGGNTTVETAQAGADILDIEENNTGKGYTVNVEEGDINGEITAKTDAEGNIISASEKKNSAAVALTDIAAGNFQVFRGQINDLDKRMGDLRTMPASDGAWAKVIAGQSQYKSMHSTYQTLQVGVDHRIGNFFGGITASYTDGDSKIHHGSTDDRNYVFGLYGGWLGDDGQFVDLTLKRHHLTSEYDFRSDIGRRSKGSYDTAGTSFSVEYGKRFNIANTSYYVEPQAEFMYGHLNSVGYTTSRGVKVNQGNIKSAVGRLGVAAGWVSPDKTGSAYIKASILNDWNADSTIRMSKNGASRRYHEDMGGTWGEFAVGGTYNIRKNLAAYGEMETTAGNPVRTTYQFNAGIRYSFE